MKCLLVPAAQRNERRKPRVYSATCQRPPSRLLSSRPRPQQLRKASYKLRYHQSSRLPRPSQWRKPSTTRWRSSINTVVTGTAAIPAYDAIIEPTEVTIVPISSNTAITASAATPWEHGPSLGRECVKNRLCIFVIFIIFSFYCILALNVKLMWLM